MEEEKIDGIIAELMEIVRVGDQEKSSALNDDLVMIMKYMLHIRQWNEPQQLYLQEHPFET